MREQRPLEAEMRSSDAASRKERLTGIRSHRTQVDDVMTEFWEFPPGSAERGEEQLCDPGNRGKTTPGPPGQRSVE
jgi:hypothetical protein